MPQAPADELNVIETLDSPLYNVMATRFKKRAMIAFVGEMVPGSSDASVCIPVDPTTCWGAPQVLEGRPSYRVQGTVQGWDFRGVVIPRAKRFWLLLPPTFIRTLGLGKGDELRITLVPVT